MAPGQDPRLPDELRAVEDRLRRQRLTVSRLELDRLKRRALDQFRGAERRPSPFRSRLAAAATVAVMLAGAGGAVALSSLDSHPNVNGGAADKQYKPPHGCKGHHHPQGKKKCPPPKPKPKPKPKAHTGSARHVTSNSAVITGTVDGYGVKTKYYFVWGLCKSAKHHGHMNHRTRTFQTGSKNGKPVSAKLGHLKPGKRYCDQLVASNARGTTRGQTRSFRTQGASGHRGNNGHHTPSHGVRQPSQPSRKQRGFTG